MCARVCVLSHHEGTTLKTSCKPDSLPKAPLPNTVTLGEGRAPTYEISADTIQSLGSTNYLSIIGQGPIITSRVDSFSVLRVLGWPEEFLYFKDLKKQTQNKQTKKYKQIHKPNHCSFMGNDKEGLTKISPGVLQTLQGQG